jgi:hypothetical protein
MALTVIDIRREQQEVRIAQYELSISRGATEEEAQNAAAAAGNLVGAQLLSQINLSSGPITPIDPYDPYYTNTVGQQYVMTVDLTQNPVDPKVAGVPGVASSTTNTIIEKINNNLVHECSQNQYIRKAVELASGVARTIILAIRKAVTAALKALGFNPALGGLAGIIKAIREFIDTITYYLNLINDFVENVAKVIAQIQALIAYILSLPAELLRLFRQCLAQAYAEIQRTIFQAISELTDVGADGVDISSATDLIKSVRELTQASYRLLEAPSKLISAATSPSTLTQTEKNSLLAGLFPGYTEYDTNSYGIP